MRYRISNRGDWPGGSIGYPLDRIFEEVAYIAFHFHWPYDQILSLDHLERQRWIEEVAKINRRLNEEAESN